MYAFCLQRTLCKYVVLCVPCKDGNSKENVYSQCATYFECFLRSFLPFLVYIVMLVTPKSITGAVGCVYVCVCKTFMDQVTLGYTG